MIYIRINKGNFYTPHVSIDIYLKKWYNYRLNR